MPQRTWTKIAGSLFRRAGRPKADHQSTTRASDRLLEYAPDLDGRADPGEIVWTWVAYEDDPSQGKDRPVLVVGRRGALMLGLMLSSQADRDGERGWLALGRGPWDSPGGELGPAGPRPGARRRLDTTRGRCAGPDPLRRGGRPAPQPARLALAGSHQSRSGSLTARGSRRSRAA